MATISIIGLVLSIVGVIIPASLWILGRRDKKRRVLAEQVIAYYYLQEVAVDEIAKLTSRSKLTIKKDLREAASRHVDNKKSTYPKMTAKEAEKYL